MTRSLRPNLLFIFADQMRGTEMGCAGNPEIQTPNLDAMAEEGVRFTHAYANAPVCTPSRACLLTGRYPLTTRVVANDLPLPETERTIGEILREAGYQTAYIGKWHLDGVPRNKFTPPGPRRHGFAFWAVWNCAHDYFNGKVYRDEPTPLSLPGYEPKAQTDLALDLLRQIGEPFCLFLSWGPPHDPYHQVPEKYRRLYDPAKLTLRPNVWDNPPLAQKLLTQKDFEAGMRQTIANYYAAITALDEQLGRLLRALEERKIAEKTLVIFTSDHGDMLYSQGSFKKQQPFEESIHIPLLFRWKGNLPEGRTCDTLFSTVDFVPTLLSLLGLEVPEDLDGQDLSWAVRGEEGHEPTSVFLMELVPTDEGKRMGIQEWRGIRTKRYTYARWLNGEGWVLFDNVEDPYQRHNLIDDPKMAPLRETLEAVLCQWMKRVGDEGLGWAELIWSIGLTKFWNERERHLHPRNPALL